MAPDPFRTPERPFSPAHLHYGALTASSRLRQASPPPIRLPPPSPTDSAISFESPLPRRSRKRIVLDTQPPSPPHGWSTGTRTLRPFRRWLLVLLCIGVALHLWNRSPRTTVPADSIEDDVLRTFASSTDNSKYDPAQWLKENADNKHAVIDEYGRARRLTTGRWSTRPRAALISLVRNEELQGILQSMQQLEIHWNHKYRYPWIFFNEKPFSDEFKVTLLLINRRTQANKNTGGHLKLHLLRLLLRAHPH